MTDSNSNEIDFRSYIGTDFSILLLLSTIQSHSNFSGYKLIKTITEQFQGKIKLYAGTVYPQLQKLEEQGLIQKYVEDTASSPDITRQKSVYELTTKGIKKLNKMWREWQDLQILMQTFKPRSYDDEH